MVAVPLSCKAQWLATVDLVRDLAWLLPIEDALRVARGNSQGQTTLMWYIGDSPARATIPQESDLEQYRLTSVIDRLLGDETSKLP